MPNLNLPMGAPPPENLNDVAFTRPEVVANCAVLFEAAAEEMGMDLTEYTWIEPSAGDGAFLEAMPPGSLALDICPRGDGIAEGNFLEWMPPAPTRGRKYVLLGNPPFGERGWLALQFLNHALTIGDMAGFILPMAFSGLESRNCLAWKVEIGGIVKEVELPVNAFRDGGGTGNSFNVRTIFQVWHKDAPRPAPAADYDVSEYVTIGSLDKAKLSPEHWDCYTPTAFFDSCHEKAQVVFNPEDALYGGGQAIRIMARDAATRQAIIDWLVATDWREYCKKALNNSCHVRQWDLRRRLGEGGFGRRFQPVGRP